MRRFYRDVATAESDGGLVVHLDAQPIRTPAKALLILPNAALAAAVADEWRAQEKVIDPVTMPLTRLANTAIDRIAGRRDAVVDEIVAYGGSDLLCYRTDRPDGLVARQATAWQPLLDWAAERYGARLEIVVGVTHEAQPAAALTALRQAVDGCTDMELAALHSATAATGSLIIALALAEARIDVEAAFAASQVDESFQAERWGEDAEEAARCAELRADLASVVAFLGLCRS